MLRTIIVSTIVGSYCILGILDAVAGNWRTAIISCSLAVANGLIFAEGK